MDAGAGGTTGTTTPGDDAADGTTDAEDPNVTTAGAGMLTVPGTVALVAAAGFALLL